MDEDWAMENALYPWLDDDFEVMNQNEADDYRNEGPEYDGEDDEDFTDTRRQEAEEGNNGSVR